MADDNKPLHYARYAIGEIVLVVIGILIALQVNEWNEGRKNHKHKELMLHAIKAEFLNNLAQLDSVISYDQRVVTSSERLLNEINGHSEQIGADSLRLLFQETTWLWTFNPSNGALRSGISSGDIHLIRNDTLLNLLFGWEDIVLDAKENEDRHIADRIESIKNFTPYIRTADFFQSIAPSITGSNYPSDYSALLNFPVFEDYLARRIVQVGDAISELKLVRNHNERIVMLIEKELGTINPS